MTEDELIMHGALSVAEGVPSYDRFSYAASHALEFEGKNIRVWTDELQLGVPTEDMNISELEYFNQRYIRISELIMAKLGIARMNFGYVNIQYRKAIAESRAIIINEITNSNRTSERKVRVPGKEALDDMCKERCSNIWTAYKLAEMWKDFWEDQHEKVKLVSFRLTGMNTIKNIESRM